MANTSPKQRFLAEEALARKFLDVVDSEAFQRAVELAMLAFIENDRPADPTAGYHRIRGAEDFLAILKALPEKSAPLPPRTSHNLNHNLA